MDLLRAIVIHASTIAFDFAIYFSRKRDYRPNKIALRVSTKSRAT